MAEISDSPVRSQNHDAPAAKSVTTSVTGELVEGLETVLTVLGTSLEAVDQYVTLIEGRLSTLTIDDEIWVPIPGAQPESRREDDGPAVGDQMAEERIFDGVAVTIMKMGAPAAAPAPVEETTREYQLGYGPIGDARGFLIRTAHRVSGAETDAYSGFSDQKPLRQAPLDVRLEGTREIATLAALLEARASAHETDAKGDRPSTHSPTR